MKKKSRLHTSKNPENSNCSTGKMIRARSESLESCLGGGAVTGVREAPPRAADAGPTLVWTPLSHPPTTGPASHLPHYHHHRSPHDSCFLIQFLYYLINVNLYSFVNICMMYLENSLIKLFFYSFYRCIWVLIHKIMLLICIFFLSETYASKCPEGIVFVYGLCVYV